MSGFSFTCSLISCSLLFSFILVSLIKFGLQVSYSANYYPWREEVPDFPKLWSIVTVVCAILLCPGMIELGEGSVLQCFGFFAPIYLVCVGLNPDIRSSKRVWWIHVVSAIGCGLCCGVWQVLIMGRVFEFLVCIGISLVLSLLTRSLKTSYTFWGELGMFSSTYWIILTS